MITRYDLVAPLHEGGMGVVYKGWDRALERPVAIKTLRRALHADPRERGRFLKEAEIVGSLRHPRIVELYAVLQSPSGAALVFEFIPGMTLHERLNDTPGRRLPPVRALEILRQLCEAVDHAHARGVVHRDLKPSNVMLAGDGSVKLMDFGVARLGPDDRGEARMLVGTPAYMAPEQAAGAAVEGSDVFALGVTLHELLTGDRPADGTRAALGGAIDAVVRKALSPRPQDRYADGRGLYQASALALAPRTAVKTR